MTFDSEAASYDDAFTHTEIGRYLRGRVHERLSAHFNAGDHVLEIGCGTGEDALFLARRGVRVTATDASASMLDIAQAKTGANSLVEFAALDIAHLPQTGFEGLYDGAFADFGPLNCIADWRLLATWLAGRVKPGGTVAFGIMAPFCLWEMLWHSLHFDFKTAFRRLRHDTTFTPAGDDQTAVHITYPTVKRLTRDFAPHFERTHLSPLGIALPPSDAFGFIEKRPQLLRILLRLEKQLAQYSRFAMLADHYWIEFQRSRSTGGQNT